MGVRNAKNEAAPAVDTASAGNQRVARFLVFCAVAGRCLLLEANHCVTFEGSGVERMNPKCAVRKRVSSRLFSQHKRLA